MRKKRPLTLAHALLLTQVGYRPPERFNPVIIWDPGPEDAVSRIARIDHERGVIILPNFTGKAEPTNSLEKIIQNCMNKREPLIIENLSAHLVEHDHWYKKEKRYTPGVKLNQSIIVKEGTTSHNCKVVGFSNKTDLIEIKINKKLRMCFRDRKGNFHLIPQTAKL